MNLTTWLIISFLATAFATPFQRPMTPDTRCANSTNTAVCHPNGEYKTQNIVCNNAVQRLQIARSIDEARVLAQLSLDYINQFGVGSALYTAYWAAGQANLDFVRDTFTFISNAQEGDRTFDCEDDPGNECDGFTTAYNFSGDVYYCQQSVSDFFTQGGNCDLCGPHPVPVNARRIRGGTTLHEISHSFDSHGRGPIVDYQYGCPQVQGLPAYEKIRNADNYHCFALSVFALTGCHLC